MAFFVGAARPKKPFAAAWHFVYSTAMKTVEEIEQEIQELPPSGVARLSAWLMEYDATVWDKQMEEDAVSGNLNFLFEEAENERKTGKLRDWPPEQPKV